MHMTVKDGVRSSTARAYLVPARKRPNLCVVTNATVEKVLFDGKRATGIAFRRGNKQFTARATREVILSAGAIGSPSVLQRSGIGPLDVLENAGVRPLHELPGVGENLQDHLEVTLQFECREPVTLNGRLNLVAKAAIGLRWLLFKDGLGSTNHFEAGAFIRSDAQQGWPDVQLHFLPAAMRYDGTKAFDGHGFRFISAPTNRRVEGVSPSPPRTRIPRQIFCSTIFNTPRMCGHGANACG